VTVKGSLSTSKTCSLFSRRRKERLPPLIRGVTEDEEQFGIFLAYTLPFRGEDHADDVGKRMDEEEDPSHGRSDQIHRHSRD
jgi:hypothetical protein